MLPTRDHEQIRAWAVRHSAVPAEIQGTADGTPAKLDFLLVGGLSGSLALNPISWEDFFARFDLFGLSMAWDDTGQFALVRVEKDLPLAEAN